MTESFVVGKVQWFDHKKGFGFVKVISPGSEHTDSEVFLHFSEIKSRSNFKKVFPGEVVSLRVEKKPDDESKFICTNVCGLYGSDLLIDNSLYTYRVRVRNNRNEVDDNEDN